MANAKLRLLTTTLAALVLAGCPSTHPLDTNPCTGGVCKITVEVSDCTKPDGFKVVPDTQEIDRPNRIEWEIVPADSKYKFTADGIDIKKNDGVFEAPQLMGGDKKFSWKDRHKDAGPFFTKKKYSYTINVKHEGGSVTCGTFDPFISNI